MSPTKLTTALLLSSLLATTHAFIPVDDVQAFPSDLDPNLWAPLTTLAPVTRTVSSATAITPSVEVGDVPDLKRQVTGQGAAAAPTTGGQISPVTTYYVNSYNKEGADVQIAVVYTQTFPAVPDQWSSATAGEIGLGTITGTIGVVRSKRSLPTQAPLADNGLEGDEKDEAGETLPSPFLAKLKGAAKHLKDELVALMDKEHETTPAEDVKTNNSEGESLSSTADEITIDVDSSEQARKPCAKSAVKNDAGRALKAGSLALLAVGLATTCATYLSI